MSEPVPGVYRPDQGHTPADPRWSESQIKPHRRTRSRAWIALLIWLALVWGSIAWAIFA